MTPQEIRRMMDFILRSQADSVIRMERMEENWQKWDEKWKKKSEKWEERFQARHAKVQKQIDSLVRETRALVKSQRNHEKRLRALEVSHLRINRRVNGIKDLMRLFGKWANMQSKRIGRLERNGR